MTELIFALLLNLLGAFVADGLVRPGAPSRRFALRSWQGYWIISLVAASGFGAVFAVTGNPVLTTVFSIGFFGAVTIASNAKRRVLGEPLLFSDLAVIGAMVKHPQFYFSVLALWQQVAGGLAFFALLGAMVWLSGPSLQGLTMGVALFGASLFALMVTVRSPAFARLAQTPNADDDVRSHGLIPVLLLYWGRWRAARRTLKRIKGASSAINAPVVNSSDRTDDVLVIVQCESFADPSAIFESGGTDLPHLAKAKDASVQHGNLHVSGFGAYTMRTEFGVLFGREETTLGFLSYDPYLTALDDPALALPQKLSQKGWRSLFVHPHDMRFYSRDQILPRAGFAELIGEDQFAKPERGEGRYVSDEAVAAKILELAHQATSPTMIYAVTMENHGPWAPHGDASVSSMVENYNRLVRAGDAMLGQLAEGLSNLERPATLVFFGDHRPTIPGASDPGGDKFTPYVIVKLGYSGTKSSESKQAQDLTPAQLHAAILRCVELRAPND